MRIENPRVGGSIPSRDTEKTARFQGDTAGGGYQGVPPDDANSRNVRNDSATVDSDDFALAFGSAIHEHLERLGGVGGGR